MRDFSRYHTPPLTPEDRGRLGQALGLETHPWHLEESCAGQVLRRWTGSSGPSWARPSGPGTDFDFATLGPGLKIFPFRQQVELWRDLLPFPFRALPAEAAETQLLGDVWSLMEAALAGFELSLVWVGNAEAGIPLLFHFVRRRCVRLGTVETLKEIGLHCLRGEWDASALQSHFGTRTGFFHWSTEGQPPASAALDCLLQAWRNCLPSPVAASFSLSPQPHSEL